MDNHSLKSWSGHEMVTYEEDPFMFLDQLSPSDLSGYYTPMSWQWEFPITYNMFDVIPWIESSFLTDPLLDGFLTYPEELFIGYGNSCGVCDEPSIKYESHEEIVSYKSSREDGEELMKEKSKKFKKCREEKKSKSSPNELTRNAISRYFYMPITQAAKELNVGLTQLKKRCRELGIGRWPHRKLMSLQTLINNIQEMGQKKGEVNEAKLRNAVKLLEQEKKLLEEMPDSELEENTKKLRQACFKANYKKRKLMEMVEVDLDSSATTTSTACMETYLKLKGQREKRVKHEFFY
ncbi:protein RKD1 [Telopea speciosissima]|uniref:protein RKD1 n=1 Tax=Telopea speciosissima TaxID=54955 RepID=UPI001CC3E8D9|nr:protein RKD1 [Telopea speciosissima]